MRRSSRARCCFSRSTTGSICGLRPMPRAIDSLLHFIGTARLWPRRFFVERWSALGDVIEQIEEPREADGGGFGALNERVSLGAERGHAERHGDAVVAARVDFSAVQLLA